VLSSVDVIIDKQLQKEVNIDSVIATLHQMSDNTDSNGCESFMVRNSIELTIDSLKRLRAGQWLDMWVIAAAMELNDKPLYVHYGLSIALDRAQGRKVVHNDMPFGRWGAKIVDRRHSIGEKQVYLCPLNSGVNHFTLLEVNEQAGMIFHYDSKASPKLISGKQEHTRVSQAVEVGIARSQL
jgi:hypothetical protein